MIYIIIVFVLFIIWMGFLRPVLCMKCFEYNRIGTSSVAIAHESSRNDEYICKECQL